MKVCCEWRGRAFFWIYIVGGRGIWRYLISSMDRIFFLMIEFHKYACSNLVAISEEVKDLDQAPA